MDAFTSGKTHLTLESDRIHASLELLRMGTQAQRKLQNSAASAGRTTESAPTTLGIRAYATSQNTLMAPLGDVSFLNSSV